MLTKGFHIVRMLQIGGDRTPLPQCALMLFRENFTFTFNRVYFWEGCGGSENK
jgi:hypothetical protein